MRIDLPSKEQLISGGIVIPLAPKGDSWSKKSLQGFSKKSGVYIHYCDDEIIYVGQTTSGKRGTFGDRMRREFHETSASNDYLHRFIKEHVDCVKTRFLDLDEIDKTLAINRFKDSFTYFYINYVENEYFELDFNTLDSESDTWLLPNQFKTEKIKIRAKDKNNTTRSISDEKELVELIKNGYYFYGYQNSIYDYDKFDSLPEKQLADYVDFLISKEVNTEVPFWLRNERNIYFEYGTHKYFPDFIFFYNKIIYVIEIKGEVFSNAKKNRLLLELNNVEGKNNVDGYVGMVVFEVQMKKLKDFNKSFEEFRKEAESYFNQIQTKAELLPEGEFDNNLKFKEFVPAYEVKDAYNKFVIHKELKSVKWLKVKPSDYPESVFACLIKSEELGKELKNTWQLFDSKIQINELAGKFIIALHPKIGESEYNLKNSTIRKINFIDNILDVGLFKETQKQIHLSSINEENLPIIISNELKEFKVIGVEY